MKLAIVGGGCRWCCVLKFASERLKDSKEVVNLAAKEHGPDAVSELGERNWRFLVGEEIKNIVIPWPMDT